MNKQLMDYLYTVLDLEESCYEQDCILNNIKYKISENKRNNFAQEELGTYRDYIDGIFIAMYFCYFEAILIISAIPLFLLFRKIGEGIITSVGWVFVSSLIISFLFTIIKSYIDYIRSIKQKDFNNQEIRASNYRATIKNSRLSNEYNAIQPKYSETVDLLNDYYDLGIIYPKYRNYACIASIVEYFEAGRCTTLGEAYNLLESDLKFKVIDTKLDTIIETLDEIRTNQSLLYESINEANSHIQQMTGKINSLANSTSNMNNQLASIEYTNKITQHNVELLTQLETYKFLTS